jgi:hypothetical protein
MGKPELAAQEWQNVLGLKSGDGADEAYSHEGQGRHRSAAPGTWDGHEDALRRPRRALGRAQFGEDLRSHMR